MRASFHSNPILLQLKLYPKSKSQFLHKPYHQTSVPVSPAHLNNLLTTASHTQNLKHATQIHAQLITSGRASLPFLLNNLINLYAKCGRLTHGLLLFSTADDDSKTVVTWTSIITRLSHHHRPIEALTFFNNMRRIGLYPNQFTFSAVLTSCAATGTAVHSGQMHSLISKHGFDADLFVGCALMAAYFRCCEVSYARKMFNEMPERNLVSWNCMIVGYLQNGVYDRAIGVFKEVFAEECANLDEVSFSSVLSACASMGELDFGKQVHGVIIKHGLMHLGYVKNSLLDMYGKCGLFEDAVKLFHIKGERDVVTWNIMIMGCIQNDKFEGACELFWVIRNEGIAPDEASFSTVLHACASLAALNRGVLIHDQVIKTGFLRNTSVASSLITMYAKCGSLVDASLVFEEIEYRNVVCWTSIITACQQHGCANQVIELFEDMLVEGISPDYITFVSVLSACGHTGRVEQGFAYFNSMTNVHGMNPGPEHYACMVDLLARAGRLDEAKRFVESMPIGPDVSIWGALLGACRNYGDLEMGREVAEKLFEMEPDNPGNYVLLSNMYMRDGMLKEANEVRRLMGINGVRKEPGCSWIDVKNTTFVFTSHDRSHSKAEEIYAMLGKLKELVKKKGYVAETQFAVNSVGEYKERSLWYHSEKLALAFGLLTLPVGMPIRIKKNLRTCGDCHVIMKFASEIFCREIIVRDINRFHRFTNGLCSCRDYW
ncbi:pentatricopeptide repeat-containing protein At4g14850-like [Malania oleifera]|uniref:pentatricopeptide repeat-containing protein At4g14850-like n=1 Tax=Malania oleifera TaxID=397392 RepID=UPI0025AE6C48|nr:pentatricopeptide repeat-containing protein At4g14850-like [Malania oleifera]